MKNSCPECAQRGLTLIELMIAMLLGVFLIGGVLQIFVSTKQTYRMQENLARLQENGRFAMNFLERDIRMAGYRSCLSYTVPSPIAGVNDDGLDSLDSVTLQYSTDACPGNPTTIIYSIQDGANGQPSLWRNDGVDRELIEGIENIQILYGNDTNSDSAPNYYVPAGTAGLNMATVVSIRIRLLLSSNDDNLSAQPLPYNYNGATITPADRRIRRVFTSTIALRNRLP